MPLQTQRFQDQAGLWPPTGRHILAQFDDTSVVVYQAYSPTIGRFAADNGWFGGSFSYERMSWIKPNFLWMMYRCGWATKPGQEVVLAVRIRRTGFDTILQHVVHSAYVPAVYDSEQHWRDQVKCSPVRLQWDPDHDPHGGKLERRAIQLGLRGEILRRYGKEWIVGIEDISAFVEEQAVHVRNHQLGCLTTPVERVYPVTDPLVAQKLGLDATG